MLYYDESSKNWGVPTFWRINQFEVPNMNWHLKKIQKISVSNVFLLLMLLIYVIDHISDFSLRFCLWFVRKWVFPGLELFHVLHAPLHIASIMFQNTATGFFLISHQIFGIFDYFPKKHHYTQFLLVFIFRKGISTYLRYCVFSTTWIFQQFWYHV